MTLYHGTTLDAWKSIFRDGLLKVASEDNSPYYNQGSKATEYGYVYLVGNAIEAVEYASVAWSAKIIGGHLSGRLLVVLEIELPDDALELDPIDSRSKPMQYAKGPYLRINRNVQLDEIVRIAAFQYDNDNDVCQEVTRWIADPNKFTEVKWLAPELHISQWNGTGSYY